VKKFFVIIIFCSLFVKNTFAQTIDWVKTFGTEQMDYFKFSKSNQNRLLINFISGDILLQKPAKMKFGNDSLYSQQDFANWQVQLDNDCNYKHGMQLFEPSTNNVSTVIDDFNNSYLLFSIYSDSIRIVGSNIWFKKPSGCINSLILVKVDSIGKVLWYKNWENLEENLKGSFSINKDNLLFHATTLGPSKIGNFISNIANQSVIVNLDTIGNFKTIISLENSQSQNQTLSTLKDFHWQDSSIVFFAITNDTLLKFRNTTLRFPYSNFQLLKFRVNLTNISDFEITPLTSQNNKGNLTINRSLQLGIDKYVIAGCIFDSISISGVGTIFSNRVKSFIAIVNKGMIIRYKVYHDLNLSNNNSSGCFYEICKVGNYFITGGMLSGNYKILDSVSTNLNGGYWFCKYDSLLNELWYLRTSDTSSVLNSAIAYFESTQSIFLIGDFTYRNYLGNKLLNSVANSRDLYIAKINDYSISSRGVSSGPYCAGDTISIPYTKDGRFNSNNEFIAELSDENGDFSGGHRQLGRILSNKDSVIKGTLPLFDVVSSGQYRIRIISTSPVVQSYYRYDPLRLLIYSKDTANAGNDTMICYGSGTTLLTSGGSRWRWSPGDMVEDSNARVTSTLPIYDSIRFRIIISDSSGCGKTDTAYKWVYPYRELKVLNQDTIVCRTKAFLSFLASGGVPLLKPYSYKWLDTTFRLLSTSGQLEINDSTSQKLILILGDGCSQSEDTSIIKVGRYGHLTIIEPIDTIYCKSVPLNLIVKAEGGTGNFNFTWKDSTGSVISSGDSVTVNRFGRFQYGVRVSDGCSSHEDSIILNVTINEPLTFVLPDDTTICYGSKASVHPSVKSGIKLGSYIFASDKDSSIGEFFEKSLKTSTTMRVSGMNVCNEITSDSVKITVLEALGTDGNKDTLLCQGQPYRLRLTPKGGMNPLVTWLDSNDKVVKSGSNIDTIFTPFHKQNIRMITWDNCSVPVDTSKMVIRIREPLLVDVMHYPYCFKDTVLLEARISGGDSTRYFTRWLKDGKEIGWDTTLIYSSNNRINTLVLKVEDFCSVPKSDTIEIRPIALAGIRVNNPIQCIGNNYFEFTYPFDSLKKNIHYLDISLPSGSENKINIGKWSLVMNDTGIFKVSLKVVSNDNQCVDSSQTFIDVRPFPKINVRWQRTTDTYDRSRWRFAASSSNQMESYTWYIDQFSPQVEDTVYQEFDYEGKIKIRVIGKDNLGCTEDSTFYFDMVHRLKFYIPNAISSNGDGLNESFYIPGAEYMVEYHLRIFNRWGEKVFDSTNPDEHFFPEFKSSNLYAYTLTIFDIYNERHIIKGTFEVIK